MNFTNGLDSSDRSKLFDLLKVFHSDPNNEDKKLLKKLTSLEGRITKNRPHEVKVLLSHLIYPDHLTYEFVECPETHLRKRDLNRHVKEYLNQSIEEYKHKHNLKSLKCQRLVEAMTGENNPAFGHGGRLSPYSKKFIKYQDDSQAYQDGIKNTIDKSNESRIANNSDNTKLSYWLEKTDGNEEEAKRLLSERQSTFSLEKCIERYGEVEGKEVWKNRQQKWQKNFKKSNYSKVSQKLFVEVYNNIKDYNFSDIFFATYDNNIKSVVLDDGKNREYTLTLKDLRVVKPDFFIKDIKLIIEFDGDYWHNQNKRGNKHREELRDAGIIESGYKLLHVSDRDFKSNPSETIQKCLEFIKQNNK